MNNDIVDIHIEYFQNWKILSIKGAFVVRTLNQIRQLFDTFEKENNPLIALNFETITFIDSSAITLLLNFSKRIKAIHGKLVIFNPNYETNSIFSLVKLEALIPIYKTKHEFESSSKDLM